MKVILTGANGFIGTEVLTQALSHPEITSIIALSRKPLPISHEKLAVLIVEDFLSYPPSLMEKLEGADGCIWTIGAKAFRDVEITRRVTVNYTMCAIEAFSRLNSTQRRGGEGNEKERPFRFVFTSGKLSERDESLSLWLFEEARKVSGSVENKLLSFQNIHKESFEISIVKPAAVLTRENGILNCILKAGQSIFVDELAAGMIDLVAYGSNREGEETKVIFENNELRVLGQEVLGREGK